MAFNVMMRWDGLAASPKEVLMDGRLQRPDQCLRHTSVQRGTALHVTQVWRTLEAYEVFMCTALADVDVVAAPQVAVFHISDLFFPPSPVVPQPRANADTLPDAAPATAGG